MLLLSCLIRAKQMSELHILALIEAKREGIRIIEQAQSPD